MHSPQILQVLWVGRFLEERGKSLRPPPPIVFGMTIGKRKVATQVVPIGGLISPSRPVGIVWMPGIMRDEEIRGADALLIHIHKTKHLRRRKFDKLGVFRFDVGVKTTVLLGIQVIVQRVAASP